MGGQVRYEIHEPHKITSAASGDFLLFNCSIWGDLGGFDDACFLYAEEPHARQRLHAMGGSKVASIGTARIYHEVGAGDRNSPACQFYFYRGSASDCLTGHTPIGVFRCSHCGGCRPIQKETDTEKIV